MTKKSNKGIFGIHKNVLALGFVSFLNDISSEMIWPILPILLAELGATGLIIGLAGGLRDSISAILQVFIGHESDKIGKRKVFVSAGYMISAFFKTILAFATSWVFVLAIVTLERVGKATRTSPRDTIISVSMKNHKGMGFGFDNALDSFGGIIGSILVLILFWQLGFGFTPIILFAGLLCFATLIPLHFVKDVPHAPSREPLKLALFKLPKKLQYFIIIGTIFALANFSYMFFVLKAYTVFEGGEFAVVLPLALYIFFNIFQSAFSLPIGSLSDVIGRRRLLIFGYASFGLIALAFIYVTTVELLAVLFAAYGIIYALLQANQKALVSDLSSEKHRATALGTFNTATGLAALPASIIAGTLWDVYSPETTFIVAALIAFVAAILLIIYRTKFKRPDRK